ncbi:hypothetical protein MMC10_006716 [Thelotrema lepadinum]|nr:hypothetical protein [Thelotrema lepadinum]
MAPLQTLLLLATTLAASTVRATPITPRQTSDPATVNFTPFAFYCEMSSNPFDPTKPVSYNLTSSSGCITTPYTFISYVENANALALEACSVSLFSGPDCTGTVSAAALTDGYQCQIPQSQSFASLEMACGP